MEKDFGCELCTEEFISQNDLNAHAGEHAALPKRPRRQYKCNLCRYEASQKYNLTRHMRTHTGERPFRCTSDGCEMTFNQDAALKNHIKYKHSDERTFKCNSPGCKYTAKTSMNLIAHKRVHSIDKPFSCSECEYKTNLSQNWKRHRISLHSGRKDFKCGHPHCTKSFKSSVDLKLHFSNRHEKRNIPCDHPGYDKKFANFQALKNHKRIAHSGKSLLCPTLTCSYRTNNASHLTRHMIVHNGRNEKISCSIDGCHYKGKHTLALKMHMRLHKTLLPCTVTGCGHYAATKKALEDHVKRHNPTDRPFQCPLCFKYYPTLSELQKHCFAHTNEKPFACGYCDFAASFRSHVKSHISSVHGGIKFPFIVHLLDDRECLECKVILSTAEFLVHCKDHTVPVV